MKEKDQVLKERKVKRKRFCFSLPNKNERKKDGEFN